MIFCNPYPIAAASQLPTAVVKDGLEAFFHAVVDLINYGRDIDLNFGFARIHIVDRNLKTGFKKNFKMNVEDKQFEDKMKMSKTACSSFWKTSYKKEWQKSTLGNLIQKPQSHLVDAMDMKKTALKLMSIDFSSTGVVKPSANVYNKMRARSRPAYRGARLY